MLLLTFVWHVLVIIGEALVFLGEFSRIVFAYNNFYIKVKALYDKGE